MIILNLEKFKLLFKFKKQNNFYIVKLKKKFLIIKNLKIGSLLFFILIGIFFQKKILSDIKFLEFESEINTQNSSNIEWKKIKQKKSSENKVIWKKNNSTLLEKEYSAVEKTNKYLPYKLGILGRSIIFDNSIVGPDISWIVPPGLAWNKKYKFDFLARGHNTRIPEPETRTFFGWNDGDAVGLFSYQFLQFKNSTFGLNFGVRSLYGGDESIGGTTAIGEGLSSGFRWDYALSDRSGLALGAEQLIHFDNDTDTGRNIYLTASKAWWNGKDEFGKDSFPLYVATAGLGSGRMAVGPLKGLCSDLFEGSGTETQIKRRLCWSPVFSLARVHNEKLSSYFEYNSRFFLLGSSLAPFKKVPVRGNFALILSDHIDNYKLHNFSELNWVFNVSLGF